MSVRRKVGGQEEAVAYGGVAMCVCVCRQPGDDIKMLVCDTCDKGYHTFCLRPAMTTIPKNGWKCKVCTSSSSSSSSASSLWCLCCSVSGLRIWGFLRDFILFIFC